jgi:regulator of protease activity HflC (stomatin/prohibitin superfamily)
MSIIFTVPQSHCVIIERFGRFSRVCKEGLHFRLPFIDSERYVGGDWGNVANKKGYLIELTEQQTDTPPRKCHTKDNVSVDANAVVYWRIVDPIRALYEVDCLPSSVSDIALNALRSNIGMLELDKLLAERQSLNEGIAAQLSKVAQKWGIQFTRVEIQDLHTSDATEAAMRQQMEGERQKRATIVIAQGDANARVQTADALRKANILEADGESKAILAIATARANALKLTAEAEKEYLDKLSSSVGAGNAGQILLAQKYLDGFDKISKNASHKVFLPNSFNGLFSISTDQNPNQSNKKS